MVEFRVQTLFIKFKDENIRVCICMIHNYTKRVNKRVIYNGTTFFSIGRGFYMLRLQISQENRLYPFISTDKCAEFSIKAIFTV